MKLVDVCTIPLSPPFETIAQSACILEWKSVLMVQLFIFQWSRNLGEEQWFVSTRIVELQNFFLARVQNVRPLRSFLLCTRNALDRWSTSSRATCRRNCWLKNCRRSLIVFFNTRRWSMIALVCMLLVRIKSVVLDWSSAHTRIRVVSRSG